MVVEGVTFVEVEIRKMTVGQFVEMCMPVHFQDRDERRRELMLRDIYKRINKKQ